MPTTTQKPPAERPARRVNRATALFLHDDEKRELYRQMAEAGEREVSRFVVARLGLAREAEPATP